MTPEGARRLAAAASLLVGVACAGAMVGGAAESYRVLSVVEASVFAAGIAALLPVLLGVRTESESLPPEHLVAAASLAALLAVAVLQCVLPGPATVPLDGMKMAIGSLAPTETAREALKLAAFLTAFLVAGRAAAGHRTLLALLGPIGGAAVLLSLHGLLRLLFPVGIPPLYPHRVWTYGDRLSATYTNPNHFAGMLEMVLPLALAGSIAAARSSAPGGDAAPAFGHGIRSRLLAICRRPASVAAAGAAVLFALALLFTRSRFGVVCGLVGVVAFVLLQRRMWRGALVLAGLATLVVACLALLREAPLSARFDTLDRDVALRLAVWRDTIHGIVTRYGVTGSGLGSFLFTFPEHQTSYPHSEFAEAHNDFLQLLWEVGVVGAVPAVLFLASVIRCTVRRTGEEEGGARLLRAGAGAAVIALVGHAVADFNLQVPANGLLFSICAGLATGAGFSARVTDVTHTK
jgi:O-antigen ligase